MFLPFTLSSLRSRFASRLRLPFKKLSSLRSRFASRLRLPFRVVLRAHLWGKSARRAAGLAKSRRARKEPQSAEETREEPQGIARASVDGGGFLLFD
jgi:hypothetical protein